MIVNADEDFHIARNVKKVAKSYAYLKERRGDPKKSSNRRTVPAAPRAGMSCEYVKWGWGWGWEMKWSRSDLGKAKPFISLATSRS
jgi:hypothetical protein